MACVDGTWETLYNTQVYMDATHAVYVPSSVFDYNCAPVQLANSPAISFSQSLG
jgi:hypothetical protein